MTEFSKKDNKMEKLNGVKLKNNDLLSILLMHPSQTTSQRKLMSYDSSEIRVTFSVPETTLQYLKYL